MAPLCYIITIVTSYSKPVIGITCGEIHNATEPWSPVVFGQSQTFVQSVMQAGGLPLLLPLTTDTELLNELSGMLDGLYLAGGNDLNPKLFGQEPLPTTKDYSDVRDTTEITLLKYALDNKKPILGICRGMQLLNVHFGGTLIQSLESLNGLDHDSSNKLKTLVDLSHTLKLEPQSRLAHIVGAEPIGANAHHHQAIDTLGKGIKAVGWAEDGIIEAIEMPDYPYAIGLQSHPESLTGVEPRWQKLFESFVEACKRQDTPRV